MIKCVTGDFFDYEADIRINTVNCVGVMGAGVALEFKNRYPDMFDDYVKACKNEEVAPGKPHIWEEYTIFSQSTIINLPTKIHWRDKSEYEYIEADLIWLRQYLLNRKAVVTLPALGCGHGGLNWGIVKAKIFHYLDDLPAKILLFEPNSSNRLGEQFYAMPQGANDVKVFYSSEYKALFTKTAYSSSELYGKGNQELLKMPRLSILCSNNPSEREISAIERILEENVAVNCVVVLPLNNKQHLMLAKRMLKKGIKIILVIPHGILKFHCDEELESYKKLFLILSFTPPNKDGNRYSYINSMKYRCEIGKALLYASEDLSSVQRDAKYLKKYNNLFYISFWMEKCAEFVDIGAQRIGIDIESGKPCTRPLLEALS